jgi:hypothetical protein
MTMASDFRHQAIAPGDSTSIRLGPFSADATVVVGAPCEADLFVSSFRVGVVDRVVGRPTPASMWSADLCRVPRGQPVTLALVNRGTVEVQVDVKVV